MPPTSSAIAPRPTKRAVPELVTASHWTPPTIPIIDGAVSGSGPSLPLKERWLSKLHLADRTQAAIYGLQKRLVPLDEALEQS